MEKIWLKHYPPNVPAEINPDAYSSLVELFLQNSEKYKDKPAFTNLGCQLTYQQLRQHSVNFAAYLQQTLKLKKGDRIALMLPNVLQYPVALFGALQAGLVVVNVNPLYKVPELVHQMNDAGAETIIVLANFAHVVQNALPQTKIKNIIITELGDLCPWPKSFIINFVVKYIKRLVPATSFARALSFKKILQEGATLSFATVSITGADYAFLQYTGGTTGVAKGAILTHRNMVANVQQVVAWIKPYFKEDHEIVIAALPLYHIFALTATCLTFVCFGALNVLITNPRDIPGFVKELAKYPFTALPGVNTLFNALLNDANFVRINFSSLKIALGGGAAVQHGVAERWKQVTGKTLLEGYGLTETSPVVCVNPLNLVEYNGSIGFPISSTNIAVRDEDGKDVALGEIGELWVQGPQVMKGYWKNIEETKKVLSEDGWLKTGDMVRVDEKGFVFLVDRKKDMIDVSGFKVYPNQVEDVIAAHPGVHEVAIIGVPDAVSGEAVKIFVVKKDPNLTEAALRDYCHEQLTGYKRPKYIEFRSSLPKSNVGKILRRALRDESEN